MKKLILFLFLFLFLPSLVKANEFNFSLSWPLKGEVLLGFGGKGSEVEKHLGVDISSSLGSRVLSPCSGKVVFVGITPKFYPKYTVSIEVVNDVWTTLSPLEEVFVEEGDFIEKGEEIGTLAEEGDSKSSPLPHLHWGLKIHSTSQYLNPLDYLTSEETSTENEVSTSTLPLAIKGRGKEVLQEELAKESLSGEGLSLSPQVGVKRDTRSVRTQRSSNNYLKLEAKGISPFLLCEEGESAFSLARKQLSSKEKKISRVENKLPSTLPRRGEKIKSYEGLIYNSRDKERLLFKEKLILSNKGGKEGEEKFSLTSSKSLLKVSTFPLLVSLLLSSFTFSSLKRKGEKVCLS